MCCVPAARATVDRVGGPRPSSGAPDVAAESSLAAASHSQRSHSPPCSLSFVRLLCVALPCPPPCRVLRSVPFRSSRQARDEGCPVPVAVVSCDDADTEGMGGWVTIDEMDHRSVGRSVDRSLGSALFTHSAPSVQPFFDKLRSSVAPRAAAAAAAAAVSLEGCTEEMDLQRRLHWKGELWQLPRSKPRL